MIIWTYFANFISKY